MLSSELWAQIFCNASGGTPVSPGYETLRVSIPLLRGLEHAGYGAQRIIRRRNPRMILGILFSSLCLEILRSGMRWFTQYKEGIIIYER